MHAKDRRFLSKSVLARVMGCDLQNLAYHVLAPLGDEAMAIGAGNFVITRHRAIAETIVDILSEDHIDLDNYYVDLVQIVQLAMQEGEYIDEVREWRSLPQFFFETGDRSLGIRLAQAAAKVSHTSEHAHFNLAQLYIEADQPEMALETLRGLPPIK
jgi:hypothetical protein